MKNALVLLSLLFFCSSFGQKHETIDSLIKARNFLEAKAIILSELDKTEKNDNDLASGLLKYYLGRIYFKTDKIDSCKLIGENLIQLGKTTKSSELLVRGYILLGNIHYMNFENSKAIDFYLKIDSISTKEKLIDEITANSTYNLGYLFLRSYSQVDTTFITKAQNYFEKSIETAKVLGNQDLEYDGYNGLGQVQGTKGEFEKALQTFKTVYEYASTSGNFEMSNLALQSLSTCYIALGDVDNAEKSSLLRLRQLEKSGRPYDIAKANQAIAAVLYRFQKNEKAIHHYKKALYNYSKSEISPLAMIAGIKYAIAQCYGRIGQYENASLHYEEYIVLKDSLDAIQKSDLSFELEKKYETNKKEQEIALLKSQNELAEQQKRNQRNLLLGGIGITSLAGLFLFLLLRNRQKTTKKLQELDQLKSKFFANISHEFRTPLTLISGPLEKRLEAKKLSKADQKDFKMMQRNSKRLLNLVDQLLDLSKLEVGKYQLRISKGDLGNFLKTLAESFAFTAERKDIAYEAKVDDLKSVWYDQDAIEKIMVNLLSNAFKYTNDGGRISLTAQHVSNALVLELCNTPTELKSSSIEKLFDRFYQAESHTDGVGIGLSLVRELVQLHKGIIEVDQPESNALQFTISLPLTKGAFNPELLSDNHPEVAQSFTVSDMDQLEGDLDEIDFVTDGDTEIVLIVEDHPDVRQFIKESFENDYQVILAKDGQEGIAKALEYVPDLIISDIMMPETDGLELCERLKSDERTSHIPIILLTAKADEEHQYEGLTQGADAYVTKPFKTKMLQTRVAKLIASRKTLRNRYSQEVILKPKDIAITNLDEQFLNRVQDVLDSKLTESSFSIQEFSGAVGMSRMQLHRKLKALTGLSASEFVRSQRLKLAASLLEQSDINVSQIGYQVGFNDPSYFTKCFKEVYGMSPSQFSKKTS